MRKGSWLGENPALGAAIEARFNFLLRAGSGQDDEVIGLSAKALWIC
jgi:hypothetical protein